MGVPLKSLSERYCLIFHIFPHAWLFDFMSYSRLDTEMYKDVEEESQLIISVTWKNSKLKRKRW